MTQPVFIGLGSNLGDREKFMDAALDKLEAIEGLEIVAVSALYVTEAEEMAEGVPSFLNQVAKGEYLYTARELLHALERIETDLDRTAKGKGEPRTIDLDILLFGKQQIQSERLTVPHLRLLERAFVMVPLLQIDPDIVHPTTGKPIIDYLTDNQRARVILYRDHVARNI